MSGGEYPDRDPQMFYGLARDRHAAQAALLDSLDSKLVFLLSGSSALLGILVAVYALRPDAFDGWEFVLPAASGAAWLVLSCFALNAFRGSAWHGGPKLASVFADQFSEKDDATLKWFVANDLWHAYNNNKPLEDRKSFALKVALGLFVSQTGLLVASLVLVAVAGSETACRPHRPAAAARDCRVALPQVTLAPARVAVPPVRKRRESDPAQPRPSRQSLMASYASSGMVRARWSACASRASRPTQTSSTPPRSSRANP